MGAFLVNVHVRTEDHAALARELRALPIAGCWVLPASNGWATIYEERASSQDDGWIKELSAGLSQRLATPVIAFLVHDSDILCYWLFDRGEPLDEFNSCPDYFGDVVGGDGDRERWQGRPEVLLRLCVPGTSVQKVERVLQQAPTFAESQLSELAPLLGIDAERATVDYRDFGDEVVPDEIGAVFIGANPPAAPSRAPGPVSLRLVRGENDEEDDAGPDDDAGLRRSSDLVQNVAQYLGFSQKAEPPDPLVADLVQAASDGNVAEIDRLVAAGARIAGTAPLKMSPQNPKSQTPLMLAGGLMAIPVSPLQAAIAAGQLAAMQRLIELGADVNDKHPMFGTPVHAAASGGASDLLQVLLEAGANANELNFQRQTPLAALRAMRQMMSDFGNLHKLGTVLPDKVQSKLDALMPTKGWDECERLLLEHGGR